MCLVCRPGGIVSLVASRTFGQDYAYGDLNRVIGKDESGVRCGELCSRHLDCL